MILVLATQQFQVSCTRLAAVILHMYIIHVHVCGFVFHLFSLCEVKSISTFYSRKEISIYMYMYGCRYSYSYKP